jgi:hypothetical protein
METLTPTGKPMNAETRKIARGILKSAKTWTKRRCTGLGLDHPSGQYLTEVALINLQSDFPILYKVVNEQLGMTADHAKAKSLKTTPSL